MRQFNAFIKKEWMEQSRTNKLLILGIVSVIFEIMSPAIAKLTPVLFEAMSDSLSEQRDILRTDRRGYRNCFLAAVL